METTLQMVRSLPSSELVAVAREFINRVDTKVPYETVLEHASAFAQWQPLLALDETALRTPLLSPDSQHLARAVLEEYAQNPAFEPLMRKTIADVRAGDYLVMDVLLTAGILLNLTLLIATTRVEIVRTADDGTTLKITKAEASPEVAKAVVQGIVQALKSSVT